jgi:hypothetical protein
MRRACVAALSLLLAPAACWAGLVEPGQTVTLTSSELTPPGGSKLDEKSTAFAIAYGDEDSGDGPTLRGVLRSSVYQTGDHLTFVYDVDLLAAAGISGAAERSDLSASAFTGFATDVAGALDFEELVKASRSADGSRVGVQSDTPGLGGSPVLIVRTDATAYDANGQATFLAADEVPAADGETRLATGSAMLTGLFRPVADVVEPPPGPPAQPPAIPLPPAAYTGFGVLVAMALIAASRRRWNVQVQ